jgi:hypothetical protein
MNDRMASMADDEFYVDDEPIEAVRAAMSRGESGQTLGSRRLSDGDQAIVDRAVSELDRGFRVIQLLYGSGGNATEIVSDARSVVRTVDFTIPLEPVAG